ncbi:hypothetical protein H6P81_016192 [Aristolochia fimbriata]|uniref:Aminotransferase-like plant mobile domain-containing protein n=1 Tax=Aristolochia fimbriata TaxID=158543 RepID=A0AAV7EBE5_ARIFI|nr:hypothetical protein H6P81_016192 [Aristolochia fimbriata]
MPGAPRRTVSHVPGIFGLPIAGQFFRTRFKPMVADFKEVRSGLPFSCRYLFLAYHHLCRSSGSNVISSAAWVEFWFRTEDDAVPVDDPWAAWHASFGKDAPSFREFTATERDVFHFLHVTPGREDEVHLAALLSVWLSRFVFRAIGDEIRPMVFKVASYMATGVRFALAGPALACLYKGLGHAAAGWPSMARWPYLYTWLAVYFPRIRGGFRSKSASRYDLLPGTLLSNVILRKTRPVICFSVFSVRCGIDMFLPPPKLLSWWTAKEADSQTAL